MKRGVRRRPGLSVEDAQALAEADGAVMVVLDTAGVSTKAGVLAAAGRTLGAGDEFGANLDALYDALRDLDPPAVIAWWGWNDLAAAAPDAFDAVVEVFEARAEEAALLVLLCGS